LSTEFKIRQGTSAYKSN